MLKKAVSLIFFLSLLFSLAGQEDSIDYNQYYRFPVSIGVEYSSVSPLSSYEEGEPFSGTEISGVVRVPIPSLPILQPFVRGGMLVMDSKNSTDGMKWDHRYWFGAGGLGVSHHFSREFEMGAEVGVGFSQSYFENLNESETLGGQNILVQAGGRIALTPSYNFAIEVTPSIRYTRSMVDFFDDFNGITMGIGFSGHYRFGEDPDSASAIIRSLRFDELNIDPLFAAMQSYYTVNPVGTVTMVNTEKSAIKDVRVYFFQEGYMDSPTPCAAFNQIESGEEIEVDLLASFNQEVFSTEGITPLTGNIIVEYISKSRPASQNQPVSYELYDKRSLTWDDDRKVSAFITPADSALQNYTSHIRQACREEVRDAFNLPLQTAMQVFHALGELGILYQQDPSSPFVEAQGNPVTVDSITLPRDTLKRITGDCDDLTVLYCSLLETAGIETAIITVPGHIYMAFNTKTQSSRYATLNPNRNMTISIEGELWIPVEITMIGKTNFLSSWQKGIEEWTAYESTPEVRNLYTTAESQAIYRPVGLKQMDLGLQYGSQDEILRAFTRDISTLADIITEPLIQDARNSGGKKDYNRLGIQYAQLGNFSEAENAFRTAMRIDNRYISPKVNLANVKMLQEDYTNALAIYKEVEVQYEERGRGNSGAAAKLYLNIAQVLNAANQSGEAAVYISRASEIDPEGARQFAYLGTPTSETASRASNVAGQTITFFDEDE